MEGTIIELFGVRDRRIKIPPYNKSYSWGKTEVERFIYDIKNTSGQHYLGHFIFFGNNKDGDYLYVIDGQQRLTTIIIFLSTIKNELENRGYADKAYLEHIRTYYLRRDRNGTQIYETASEDNNFFLDEIIDCKESHNQAEDTDSKKNIRNAKSTCKNEFLNASTENLVEWCNIIENSFVTFHAVGDKTRATQIFFFNNDIGKDKNDFLSACADIFFHCE